MIKTIAQRTTCPRIAGGAKTTRDALRPDVELGQCVRAETIQCGGVCATRLGSNLTTYRRGMRMACIIFVFGGRTAGGLCHSYVRSEARRDGDTRTRARATFGALVDNAEHAAPHGRLALAVHRRGVGSRGGAAIAGQSLFGLSVLVYLLPKDYTHCR